MSKREPLDVRKLITGICDHLVSEQIPMWDKVIVPNRFEIIYGDSVRADIADLQAELTDQITRALETTLQQLNSSKGRLPFFKFGARMPYEKLTDEWIVEFKPDPNAEPHDGRIEIRSRIFSGPTVGLNGLETQPWTGGQPETIPFHPDPAVIDVSAAPIARILYYDRRGPGEYVMRKPELSVGRGDLDVWVDLRLDAGPGVSRKHLEIRRVAGLGLEVKDVSVNGTFRDGMRLQKDLWVEWPQGQLLTLTEGVTLMGEAA